MLNDLNLIVSIVLSIVSIIGTLLSWRKYFNKKDNSLKKTIRTLAFLFLIIFIASMIFTGYKVYNYTNTIKFENIKIKKDNSYRSKLFDIRDELYSGIIPEYTEFITDLNSRSEQKHINLLKNIEKLRLKIAGIPDDSLKGRLGFYLNKYDNLSYVYILKSSLEINNKSRSNNYALKCLELTKVIKDSIVMITKKVSENPNSKYKVLKDWIFSDDLYSRIRYFRAWAFVNLYLNNHIYAENTSYKELINQELAQIATYFIKKYPLVKNHYLKKAIKKGMIDEKYINSNSYSVSH